MSAEHPTVVAGVDAASRRALEIRGLYETLEKRINGRVWSLHELLLGLNNDVGAVGRLILADEGTWLVDGDAREQLEHKLAETLWWVMVIADRLDIDIAAAYDSTMAGIERGLLSAVGADTAASPSSSSTTESEQR